MTRRSQDGFTLVEVMVTAGIVGALTMIAIPSMERWNENQRVKSAGRNLAAAFTLAHGEAIRTGGLHIVFFRTDAQGLTLLDTAGKAVPLLVINDGRPGDAGQNCRIDAGEIIAVIQAERDVGWGVGDLGRPKVPNDSGAGAIASGSSFADPDNNAANWVMFRPEGMPVSFTPACVLGGTGSGAGGAYVSNGKRDYAIVLSPLGGIHVHGWNGATNSWTN